jgi:predicted heme/steroid binding protein
MRTCLVLTLFVRAFSEFLETESSVPKSNTASPESLSPVDDLNSNLDLSKLPVYTLQSLRPHNGTNASMPILLGLKGMVFDVTNGVKFYIPGKSYAHFAGRDVTRSTAMFSTKYRDLDRIDYPPEKQDYLDSEYEHA